MPTNANPCAVFQAPSCSPLSLTAQVRGFRMSKRRRLIEIRDLALERPGRSLT
jgi:hypothetical protein